MILKVFKVHVYYSVEMCQKLIIIDDQSNISVDSTNRLSLVITDYN